MSQTPSPVPPILLHESLLPYQQNHHVIIDTDLGSDDVFAITNLTAATLKNPNMKICAISLVKGMQLHLDRGIDLIQRMQQFSNFLPANCQLFMGSSERISNEKSSHCFSEAKWFQDYDFYRIHRDLADLIQLPKVNTELGLLPVIPEKEYEDEMIKLLEQAPHDSYYTWFSIGPLTNLAKLCKKNSELVKKKLKMVIIMGGALFVKEPENEKNGSEWNFFCDGEAAKIVLETLSEKILLFELSVANLTVVSQDNLKVMQEIISTPYEKSLPPIVKIRHELLLVTLESTSYDTSTSCVMFCPELFTFQQVEIQAFGQDPLEGVIQLVAQNENNDYSNNGHEENCEIIRTEYSSSKSNRIKIWCATSIHKERFFEIVKERLLDFSEYY
ncbi:hypothetical protein C9374_010981 [Naegleria lovaniensis]|uniref:Inosine/uridine-preferring nucleoside hydrolase domain-containing protein n=1 Tax=Naegleria lovaniensis TaxID=51637 RepID=A0AA88GGG7_NAELO|nr:uncharacterized protein C9374_010981 [Naegleria lovaniensis]KAG2374144.1 hypothetical protein C9374_010981 [Naegleria lovaniensis]